MAKKLIILLFFLLTPLVTFADSLNEYQNCINECYSHDDWSNEQYSACLSTCSTNFPQGAQEWGEQTREIGPIKIESTASTGGDAWQPIILNVPIGGITQVASFGEYFKTWYSFTIGAVGVLATVMIMWGGFKWLTSRGNSGVISESKQIIWSALIGVVLAFLSYTILYLINPQLTTIGLPTLETAEISVDESHEKCGEVTLTNGKKTISNPCPEREGTYSKSEEENRNQVKNSGAQIQNGDVNMSGINDETINKIGLLAADAPTGSITITSGYRANTANHGRGDTIDIKNNPQIDPFIMGIIGNTQGTTINDGFEMIIYKIPENKYGITRIIDERQKSGATHWHIEF